MRLASTLNFNQRIYDTSHDSFNKNFDMKKIGLVSDTHGHIDDKLFDFFKDCDEIWHAGDIGTSNVIDILEAHKPVRAVFGNIDGTDIRLRTQEHARFMCEGVSVWITHIGGYPGNYDVRVRNTIRSTPPDLFISGHSHILKVMPDKKHNLLHINPGAYGKSGFHHVRTALRFKIEGKNIFDLEILEIDR